MIRFLFLLTILILASQLSAQEVDARINRTTVDIGYPEEWDDGKKVLVKKMVGSALKILNPLLKLD